MSEREWHQVAIVVFAEAKGVDQHDAEMTATMALRNVARPGTTVPVPHMNPAIAAEEVRVCDYMDVGMAAGNGYLWTTPTGRAFRMHRFPWSPPEEES